MRTSLPQHTLCRILLYEREEALQTAWMELKRAISCINSSQRTDHPSLRLFTSPGVGKTALGTAILCGAQRVLPGITVIPAGVDFAANSDDYPTALTDEKQCCFEFSARLLCRVFFGTIFRELRSDLQEKLRKLQLKIPHALQCIAQAFVPPDKVGLLVLHLDEVQLLSAAAAKAITSDLESWYAAGVEQQPMAARYHLAVVPILTGTRINTDVHTSFTAAFPECSLLPLIKKLSDKSIHKIVFADLPKSIPIVAWAKRLAAAIAAMGGNPRLLGCGIDDI